jgi:hypothetical protein
MNNLVIEATRKTPGIFFDVSNGIFEISGRSIPENSYEFYKPVVDWLNDYISAPLGKTVLKVSLDYFNTSSSKALLDIFKKLEVIYKRNNDVLIEWYYEEDDEDMQESGEDYASIIKVPLVTRIISS